jgi:hypothetical protein
LRSSGGRLVAATLAGIVLGTASIIAGQEPAPVVTLRIYDNVRLAPATWAELRASTVAALVDTGVTLDWRYCGQAVERDDCHRPEGSIDVILRVVRSHRTRERKRCGFALSLPPEAAFISLDTDCAFRSVALLNRKSWLIQATEAQILGYTLAHELAHVLLPGVPHSDEGLFRARLTREDLARIPSGELTFLPQDIERLRLAALGQHQGIERQ